MFSLLFFVYRALLWALTPVLAALLIVHPRLRRRRGERWGLVSPEVEPGAVWIHAASLGEGRVCAALIRALREGQPTLGLIRTCTSDTAREQAVGADQSVFAPIDHPFAVAAFLDRVRPRCLVLVEAELWPVLLGMCRVRQIPVAVVNARIGPGLARLRAWPSLWAALTRDVEWITTDAATASLLGGFSVGDLKAEAPVGVPALQWSRPTIVAGSTHEGEELSVLEAVAALPETQTGGRRPLLVLAPRDPRRFEAVWSLITAQAARSPGLVVRRRTRIGARVEPDVDVLLLDTIGELGTLYQRASAAFVGGTFTPSVGGHSPAEALGSGCPVVHGPYVHSTPGAWDGVAGFVARTPAALASAFDAALQSPRATPKGARAADNAVRALELLWEADVPEERVLRPWLLPLVPFWRVGVAARFALARPRRIEGGHVVSVGALTAGGAGKTPVAAWIAGVMNGVVVSRGFGRDAGRDLRTAGEADKLGDELAMLARRGLPVVSSPDRAAAVARVFTQASPQTHAAVAVLDDGLQVAEVARDLEVVVVDVRFPAGGGMIPAGSGRLPLSSIARADVLWLNHAEPEQPVPAMIRRFVRPDTLVVRARYRAVGWLFRRQLLPLDALPDRPAGVFAGIAHPEGFFAQLRQLGVNIDRTWVFPDHHRYVWTDLQAFEAWRDTHVMITTEKDAARLPPDESVWALRVEPVLHSGDAELRERLTLLVGGE